MSHSGPSVNLKSFIWRCTHRFPVLLDWVERELLLLLLGGCLGGRRHWVHVNRLAQRDHLGAGVVLVLTRLSLAVVLRIVLHCFFV